MHVPIVRFLMPLLLITAFAQPKSQQPATLEAPEGKPGIGEFKDNIYRNPYFGLSYTLGEGWSANEELREKGLAGFYYLLVADKHIGRPTLERIMFYAKDRRDLHKTRSLEEWTRDMVHALVNRAGMELVRDAYPATYAGTKFYRGDYKDNSRGTTHYLSFLAAERKGFLLNWTFVADSETRRDELVNSLRSLSFSPEQK